MVDYNKPINPTITFEYVIYIRKINTDKYPHVILVKSRHEDFEKIVCVNEYGDDGKIRYLKN